MTERDTAWFTGRISSFRYRMWGRANVIVNRLGTILLCIAILFQLFCLSVPVARSRMCRARHA